MKIDMGTLFDCFPPYKVNYLGYQRKGDEWRVCDICHSTFEDNQDIFGIFLKGHRVATLIFCEHCKAGVAFYLNDLFYTIHQGDFV